MCDIGQLTSLQTTQLVWHTTPSTSNVTHAPYKGTIYRMLDIDTGSCKQHSDR